MEFVYNTTALVANAKVRIISKSTSQASVVLRNLFYVNKSVNDKDVCINILNIFMTRKRITLGND